MRKIFKLKFTLEQVVAMIHFQGDEKDATIRATELKPKLDKFLYHYYAWENKITWNPNHTFDDEKNKIKAVLNHMKSSFKESVMKRIVLDNEKNEMKHHALNYRVRITGVTQKSSNRSNESLTKETTKKSGITEREYAGAAKYVLKEKKKGSIFTRGEAVGVHKVEKRHDNVIVEIICFEEELAKLICKAMPIFTIANGFGFASGKGYGSFRVNGIEAQGILEKCNDAIIHLKDAEYLLNQYREIMNYQNKDAILIYQMVFNPGNIEKPKNVIDWLIIIDQYNHFIKSGQNIWSGFGERAKRLHYAESPLMKGYFKTEKFKQTENEKKVMKVTLLKNGYQLKNCKLNNQDNIINKRFLYTRGLFGFAQEYPFKIYNKAKAEQGKDPYPLDQYVTKVFVKSEKNEKDRVISRFANPISYRIVFQDNQYKVFMIINQADIISLQKLNPRFIFTFKPNKNITVTAYLPSEKEFNVRDFFETQLQKELGKKFRYVIEGKKYINELSVEELMGESSCIMG